MAKGQPGNICSNCSQKNTTTAKFCRSCGTQTSVLTYGQSTRSAGNAGQTGLLTGMLNNGQYQIIRRLGQGGMGAVYLAKDLFFGDRQVAIKEMSQSNLLPTEKADAVEAFQHEALLLGNLRHGNLPHIYAHFQSLGRWYLVMDYIEGETLEDLLEKSSNGRLSVDTVFTIGIQLCTVLQYLHTRKPAIIFRDLKPANIMFEGDTTYLIDFGIARHFKPGQHKDTTALGSQGYAAPEQYGKSQTTPRSDIYSLGATLHHLLSGSDPSQRPFKFASLLQSGGVFQSGHPALKDLDTLIQQMVAMDEDQRPVSMAKVKTELQNIADAYARPASPYHVNTPSSYTPPTAQGTSLPVGLQQITLLYAAKDVALAKELDAHLNAAAGSYNLQLRVHHNDNSIAGSVVANVWASRLQGSMLFIPLISADLWATSTIYTQVKKVVASKPADQIIPVWLRPCMLDQDQFEGINVVPSKAITSYSSTEKENAWLLVVGRIIQALKVVGQSYQALPTSSSVISYASSPYSSSAHAPVQPSYVPPASHSSNAAFYTPPTPVSTPAPALSSVIGSPPVSSEWEVMVLYAPEDEEWLKPLTRCFTIMQRTTMSSIGVRFVIHRGAEGLPGENDVLIKQRLTNSRLTLALISPDFLASDWIDRYDQMNAWLRSRGHNIIPIWLRKSEWNGGQPVPRKGPIERVGNDEAWTELSKELRRVLEGYYPNEMPRQQRW